MPAPASANRIVCSRCGANNFDTQAACWKCGAALAAGGTAAAVPVAPAAAASQYAAAPAVRPSASPAGMGAPAASPRATDVPVAAPLLRPQPSVDPAIANWTAIISSLLMPYIMFPVGIVFLMLDDRRKLELGRITLIASTVGTVLNLFFSFLLFGATLSTFVSSGPGMVNWAQKLKEAQKNQSPDMNESAPQLDLPGLRPMGGQQQPGLRLP